MITVEKGTRGYVVKAGQGWVENKREYVTTREACFSIDDFKSDPCALKRHGGFRVYDTMNRRGFRGFQAPGTDWILVVYYSDVRQGDNDN